MAQTAPDSTADPFDHYAGTSRLPTRGDRDVARSLNRHPAVRRIFWRAVPVSMSIYPDHVYDGDDMAVILDLIEDLNDSREDVEMTATVEDHRIRLELDYGADR